MYIIFSIQKLLHSIVFNILHPLSAFMPTELHVDSLEKKLCNINAMLMCMCIEI